MRRIRLQMNNKYIYYSFCITRALFGKYANKYFVNDVNVILVS